MTVKIGKPKFIPKGRTAIAVTALGVCVSAAALYAIKRRGTRTQEPTIQKEVKYVFFSAEGKPVTLSEQDVFDVKQKYEDGVLPTIIADEYDMNAVMVCRIVNSIKSL